MTWLLLVTPAFCYWFDPNFAPLKHEFDWFMGAFSSVNPSMELWRVYSGKFLSGALFVIIGLLYAQMFCDIDAEWEHLSWKRLGIRILVPTFLATAAVPWLSPDVFYYLAKGKIESGYHQNAYIVSLNQVDPDNKDPLIQNVFKGFKNSVGNYGPLFQKLSAWVSAWGKGQPRSSLIYFKLVCLASHILICAVLYQMASILILPPKTTVAIYALNPVVLFSILVGAHNDVLMMACTLLSAWMALKRKSFAAGLFLGMGFALKYVPLMLLPAFIIYWFLVEKNWKERITKIFSFGVAFIGIIMLSYCLYPNAVGSFTGLVQGGLLLIRSSLTQLLILPCLLLSLDYAAERLLIRFLFLAAYACYWYFTLKHRHHPNQLLISGILWTYTLYLLIDSTVVVEWYLTWIIPLAILLGKRYKLFALWIPVLFLPLAIFTIKTTLQGIIQTAQYLIFAFAVFSYLISQLYNSEDTE